MLLSSFLFCFIFEFYTEVRHTQSIVHTYTKKPKKKKTQPKMNILEGQGFNCPLKMMDPRKQEVHVVSEVLIGPFILNLGCFLSSTFCAVNFLR